MTSSDRPRRYVVTRADTRTRHYVRASGHGRHAVVTLMNGTRLRRLERGIYADPTTGVRYGAESDEAP